MSVSGVKFNTKDQPEFFKVLRKRVNQHFKENNISKYANLNMKIKTVFMLLLYFCPLILMSTQIVTGTWPVLFMWVLMGFGMSGIGLSIMHDANHGSYSQHKIVNKAMGFLINFIGGYEVTWKIQHNVLHHSFTNIDGHDEDIAKNGILRMSPHQEYKSYYKYQVFYAPFLYGIMTIYWLVGKDLQQVFRYNKKNLLVHEGITKGKALAQLAFGRICYLLVIILPPFLFASPPWWQLLLGFLLMHFISGLVLALIFQPAHVIEETEFFAPDENSSVENNWAIHQMKTTANFANRSTFFSWFIGGLNFQIEHHLFPNICHIHYKNISSIVKKTAKEFGVPYYQHETFLGAVKSHFSLLSRLGAAK